MITCDQAFDCMTDARRKDSPELAAHLADCPRCRQMAETLAPAVDLLTGPVPPWMSGEAVATRTAADTETVALAVRSARRLGRARTLLGAPLRRSLLASMGGALVGALAMALLLPAQKPSRPAAGEVCTWQNRSAAMVNDAQTLALSCVVCHIQDTK